MHNIFNKQNGLSTHYATRTKTASSQSVFGIKKQHISDTTEHIEHLSINVETLMQRLKQKISLDQSKIQQNYRSLEQISKGLEGTQFKFDKEKEVEVLSRNKKQQIRQYFYQSKQKIKENTRRYQDDVENLDQNMLEIERKWQQQKLQRQSGYVQMIQEFEQQTMQLQKQLRNIRNSQSQALQHIDLKLFNLQEHYSIHLEQQTLRRKQQHQTLTRLVSECIQNLRYIY